MFGPLAAWIVSHRALVSAGMVLILLGVGAGVKDLRVDMTFTAFVGSNDPEYDFLLGHMERWGRDDENMTVLAATDEGSLLDPERLAVLEEALVALEASEDVERASGLPRLPWPADSVPGVLDLKPLHEVVPVTPDAHATWAKRLLTDDAVVPGMLSEDGRRAMLILRLGIDVDDLINIRPTVEETRATLAPLQGKAGVSFQVAGIPTVRADLIDLIISDTITLALGGALFILLALILLFRSVHGVLVPLLATAVPLLLLLGLMGWTGEPIGLLSQAFATLIPAIAAADAIHVVSRFHEEVGARLASGASFDRSLRDEAIVAAMSRVGTACLFTSLTTAVGFGSLVLADMRALQRFGMYAAAGISFAFITMVVVIPLFLGTVRKAPRISVRTPGPLDHALGWVARFSVTRPAPILVVTAVLVVASVALGTRVHVDNWLRDNLTPSHPTQVANDVLDEALGGSIPGNISVELSEGSALDPATLAALDRVERWLRANETVRTVIGPATLLRRLQQTITGEPGLPSSRALAEQLLLLAGADDDTALLLTADRKRARVVFQLPDIGARGYRAFATEARAELAAAFADTSADARLTGLSHVAYLSINHLVGELIVSLLAALAFIALVLAFLFRSIKVCLISLLPNCAPLALALGAMGALGWDLNPTSAVVFTVALGIAVDDTIHLLARVHAAPADWPTARALDAAVRSTGRALVVTTVVLLGGFGLVAVSAFRINRWFGALSAIAIGSALLFDLFALPAMLSLTGRARTRR